MKDHSAEAREGGVALVVYVLCYLEWGLAGILAPVAAFAFTYFLGFLWRSWLARARRRT